MSEILGKKNVSGKVERPPALDRAVSANLTEEKLGEIMLGVKEIFDNQDLEEFKKGSVELTQEQKLLIERADILVNEELAEYGIKGMKVPPENIHVINLEAFQSLAEKRRLPSIDKFEAVASVPDQGIAIKDQPRSNYEFFLINAHEVGHLKSFISGNVPKEIDSEELISFRRQGWSMENRKSSDDTAAFHKVDEAIIEMIAQRVVRGRAKDVLGPEFEVSEKLRLKVGRHIRESLNDKNRLIPNDVREFLKGLMDFFNNDVMFLNDASDIWDAYLKADDTTKREILADAAEAYGDPGKDNLDFFHYVDERRFFNKLLDRLYEKNKDSFSSRDEIFALFVKGGFGGNIMPVARLVEKTFGKGSFRRLGEGEDITVEENPKNYYLNEE